MLVEDINQAPASPAQNAIPSQFLEFNNSLFFSGVSRGSGQVLLSYDGTDISIVDETNLAGTANPRYLTEVGGKVYFLSAASSNSSMKLMEFDGVNPPLEVYDINAPFRDSYPQPYVYNGKIYFTAYTNAGDWELIGYDSSTGTSVISSSSGSSNYCSVRGITSINSLLYFYVDGIGFFTYNGIGAPSLSSSSSVFAAVSAFQQFNNAIYFAAFQAPNGLELWKYDGSLAPAPVSGIANGSRLRVNLNNASVNTFEVFNNELYFNAAEDTAVGQLWKTDGVTTSFIDIASQGIAAPRALTTYNNSLYFGAFQSSTGFELWSYNGSTVSQVQDIYSGTSSSGIQASYVFNNKLYFGATDGTIPGALFTYDETSVQRATNETMNMGSQIKFLTRFQNKIYFRAYGANGSELYATDGSSTTLVADIYPGFNAQNTPNSSAPQGLFTYNNTLYFKAYDTSGYQMFEYDGSNAPVISSVFTTSDVGFYEYNGELYFSANRGPEGKELWKYDGTNAPSLVADISAGSSSSLPGGFTTFNNKLIFSAADTTHGMELWQYDGVSAPTLVADINPDSDSEPSGFMEYNNKLYFSAFGSMTVGTELYEYDGVNAPQLTADLWTGTDSGWPNSSYPHSFEVINNKLVFIAENQGYFPNLWEYDGTGTPTQVTNFMPAGSNSWQFSSATQINDKLFFWADEATGFGAELYVYDGISAPSMLPELSPGIARSRAQTPSNMVELNGYAYLNANDWLIGGPSFGLGELYRFRTCNAPTLSIVQNGNNLQADTGFVSYQWYNSQGAIAGANAATYTATSNDTYYCEATNSENCTGTSNVLNVILSSITHDESQSISLYPNPTSGVVNIAFSDNTFAGEVRVINALGQEVFYLSTFTAEPLQFDLPKSKGLYVVEIANLETQTTTRFKLIRK